MYYILLLGNEILSPGTPIGLGLSEDASRQLSLNTGTKVVAGLIDAYAGLLGGLSGGNQMVTIAGTSACHMTLSKEENFINGIWGPYKNVLTDSNYVLEAGQSVVGNLLDQILKLYGSNLRHSQIKELLLCQFATTNDPANNWIELNRLASSIHVNPDFLGNRSPRPDSNIRGAIIGLETDSSDMFVARVYLATVQGLCYGVREILKRMNQSNINPSSVVLCGGLVKNSFYPQILSDVTGLLVYTMSDMDMVLMGTAKLCFLSEKPFDSLLNNVEEYEKYEPTPNIEILHNWKYKIYKELVEFQTRINQL